MSRIKCNPINPKLSVLIKLTRVRIGTHVHGRTTQKGHELKVIYDVTSYGVVKKGFLQYSFIHILHRFDVDAVSCRCRVFSLLPVSNIFSYAFYSNSKNQLSKYNIAPLSENRMEQQE